MRQLGVTTALVLLFVCIASGLAACGANPATAENGAASAGTPTGKLVLTGSSTIAPLASELGKLFEAKYPGVRVDVQSGGTSRGITDARQGLADIGMASRALTKDETDLLSFTIAYDGICPIVHTSNPVQSLTDAQIVDIYLGKITNWKDVGGNDAPITVINKAEGRSTLDLFVQYFKIQTKDIKAQVVIGENEEAIKSVIGNPNAIAYVSIGSAEYEATQGSDIKLLPIKGIAATIENVKNHSFPLSRPLNLVTKTQPQGLVKLFIDFARSSEAFPAVKEQFFVPLSQ
jgi:phosphate transport system substrate-binding protein